MTVHRCGAQEGGFTESTQALKQAEAGHTLLRRSADAMWRIRVANSSFSTVVFESASEAAQETDLSAHLVHQCRCEK